MMGVVLIFVSEWSEMVNKILLCFSHTVLVEHFIFDLLTYSFGGKKWVAAEYFVFEEK